MQGEHGARFPGVAVADARGAGFVQLWYAGLPGNFGSCNDVTLNRDGSWTALGGGGYGQFEQGWPVLVATGIQVTDHSSSGRPVLRSYLAGRIGQAIVAVRLVRPGQIPVEAAVANGWWGLWVEGAFPPGTVVRGFGASGQPLAEVVISE